MSGGSGGDRRQLELIVESLVFPEREDVAKRLLLRELYSAIVASSGVSANGGVLSSVPECVRRFAGGVGEPCEDDMGLSYNAIRVLMSRYISRDSSGRFAESPSMVFRRVAEGLGFGEPLYRLMVEGRFMFNSPTLFNMYVDGAHGTLSACYVTPVYDDMASIMDASRVQAMTFKYGGGQGFSFSNLRPRWSFIKGTGSFSSGPVSFMMIFDTVTESVKQGGKRRGANMGILHVWHPDVYNPYFDVYSGYKSRLPPHEQAIHDVVARLVESGVELPEHIVRVVKATASVPAEEAGFIQIKEGVLGDVFLTNFNISVGVNDAFMDAVIRDKEWTMVAPQFSGITTGDGDYRIHYTISKKTGSGSTTSSMMYSKALSENPFLNVFEDVLTEAVARAEKFARESGVDTSTKNPYVWRYPARKLFEKIVENAWSSGDPGMLYMDNHNKWNPTPWLGVVVATNPCGEQYLYPFENCNLASIALDKYVEQGVFLLDEFFRDVQLVSEAMDTVIDKNLHPDERQRIANALTRKIGLGIMGLADALVKLGYPYDSEEAVAFTMIVSAGLEAFSWKKSWELGASKGHAPAFECAVWDWRNFKCLKEARPEELRELHRPALLKAGSVVAFEDGWVTVKYHDVELPDDMIKRLTPDVAERVGRDGSIRLVRFDVLLKVLRDVFGVTPEMVYEARDTDVSEVVNNPKLLLALAVLDPKEAWKKLTEYGLSLGAKAPRNTVMTTIAPTGTISILAGTSSGIEPYFALVFKRQVAVGTFLEVVRQFKERLLELAHSAGITNDELMEIYSIISRNKGSLRASLDQILDTVIKVKAVETESGATINVRRKLGELARLFPSSMDFPLWYHIAHQISAQLYVDQSISKTINMPQEASVDDVYTVYLVGWLGGLKGVTIYRDKSKATQVIEFGVGKLIETDRRRKRLAIPKKNGGNSVEEVVVGATENSTCKTCHI